MWISCCRAISSDPFVLPSGQHWHCINSIAANSKSKDYILIGKHYQWKPHLVLLQHAPALSHCCYYPNILFHLWRHPQLSTALSPLHPLLADGISHLLDVLWVFVADVMQWWLMRYLSALWHPLPTPCRGPLYRLIWSQHLSRVWPWWPRACRLFRCPQSKRYTQIQSLIFYLKMGNNCWS